jgi:CubicO group peptidase (beta-lactamase class C family)
MSNCIVVRVGVVCSLLFWSAHGVANQGAAATLVETRLHDYIAARAANGDFSGTVAVRRGGQLVYEESFGFADFENRTPFNEHSRFEVASITKTFTAAAIAILLTQEKLTLDSTLDTFFPDFPRGRVITIRHLLSHASGLGELPQGQWITQSHPLPDVVSEIGKQPFLFAPGTSERYSNSGFVLLAAVIEKVSGRSYDEFLHEQLFQPLGMTETGNYSPQEILPGRVHKYQPGPTPDLVWNIPVEDLSYATGAGSASSTASDLLRWLRAARLHSLFTRPAGEYPYGWGKETYIGRLAMDQTGLHAGASVAILTIPQEELDVVCLSNLETGFFTVCAKDVAAIVLGEPVSIPTPRKGAAVSLDMLRCFQGDFRANKRLAFNLRVSGNFLLFSWLDFPRDSYIRPLDENTLFIPSQSADLTVGDRGSTCRVMVINWKTPWDELHFVREGSR